MSWRRKGKPVSMSAVSFALPNFTAMRGYPPFMSDPVQGPLKIEDLGLAIEPIVGIRSFQVDMDFETAGWTLYSYNGVPWPYHKPMAAHCGADLFAAHEVPDENCQCGIYAWKSERPEMQTGNLRGEVYLWGEVLICDLGYRAEFAYPKSLTINAVTTRSTQRVRDGLAEAYGVPVTIAEPKPVTLDDFPGSGATGPTTAFYYPPNA